ncbi:glycerate kinase [Leptolyngbya ohadii]|uniref:glycerate kinase n=1 Tax=Leptolyngbya ohadii TaxID=1962290 RepID=UPI000B5A1314|nr:glycerate kinase [Leptolyngbya ohadii]
MNQSIAQNEAFLQQAFLRLQTFFQQQGWQTCSIDLCRNFWMPLAQQIADWRSQNIKVQNTLVVGILGGQGSGKTTLAAILSEILSEMGLQVCRLSIDDLYKTYADRLLLQQFDPRFRWRGPPGTHDVDLGLSVLQQLRQASSQSPVALPRFDKSLHQGAGDRIEPQMITAADVVLFEGWFVGIRPIDPALFDRTPVLSESDDPKGETASHRAFARDVNDRLCDYLPLWNELDRLIVLHPIDYRLTMQWRKEAEQMMKATGKPGMSDAEIEEFVQYFWRSLHPKLFLPLLNPLRTRSPVSEKVVLKVPLRSPLPE